ncbi:MAG: MgtC/SapB family protein [Gemmataceae bacterium]|nr:MgtC/SapB family protein [Gemmataceae bacterium]
MDWRLESMMALRALIAVSLGGLIGWERQWHGREAGIRTYGAVSLGACVFALISTHVTGGNNPHVIAAGVVTGVGFLGAGVILHEEGRINGLTTAATLWSAASVGLATGYGMYLLALLTALIVFGLLAAHHIPGWSKPQRGNDDQQGQGRGEGEADGARAAGRPKGPTTEE